MPYTTNTLLDSLAELERVALKRLLTPLALKQHDILFDVREGISTVYFPTSSVVSLIVPLATGENVEFAMVGRDGAVGAASVVNGKIATCRAIVQLAGGCLCCKAEDLKHFVTQHPAIASQINGHEQTLMAQAQQSAACNITHNIENRLARWLLRARDLSGSDELNLTQEYIADMLGVRRTSVSVVAHTLQQAGMLRYRRGHIELLNIEALKETACECYEAVKLNYDALTRSGNSQNNA
jgi:CRP-like cAMP-binding protein